MLTGQNILLGVTGGIAAYKSPDLVRRLREAGATVQVVMTAGAQQFVTPLTFQAVSGREVRSELFDSAGEAAMGHIELARWADQILIAPASADFLARLTQGRADDLLTTLCLATEAAIAVCPAMNRLMWSNAATQANVEVLLKRGIEILGPDAGEQACGETGTGRMLEPTAIVSALQAAAPTGPLAGGRVLITAGPTREPIDPVRFISNRSSGKMGYAVAEAARRLGAKVTLISGPVALPAPVGVELVSVESAQQMYHAVLERASSCDIYVGAAAVADYRPTQTETTKIKKKAAELAVQMVRTDDILATVAERHPEIFTVGFAAETHNVVDYARAKLQGKRLNMIAANEVGAELAFDQDHNQLTVLWQDEEHRLPLADKRDLAENLMRLVAERYDDHRAKNVAVLPTTTTTNDMETKSAHSG